MMTLSLRLQIEKKSDASLALDFPSTVVSCQGTIMAFEMPDSMRHNQGDVI